MQRMEICLNCPMSKEEMERKAVGKNIADLRDAGIEIGTRRAGSYIASREFEDSELRLLIDGVLSSRHITARHSKDLIEKLCKQGNQYFRPRVKNIYSVNDWNKTDNVSVFYTIEIVDESIQRGRQVRFEYNKYGADVTYMYEIILEASDPLGNAYIPISVDKRNIEITAASNSKVYDGTPLTDSAFTITKGTLVEGHYIKTPVHGSITNVGTVTNRIDPELVRIYDSEGRDVTANYNISTVDGILNIIESDD